MHLYFLNCLLWHWIYRCQSSNILKQLLSQCKLFELTFSIQPIIFISLFCYILFYFASRATNNGLNTILISPVINWTFSIEAVSLLTSMLTKLAYYFMMPIMRRECPWIYHHHRAGFLPMNYEEGRRWAVCLVFINHFLHQMLTNYSTLNAL